MSKKTKPNKTKADADTIALLEAWEKIHSELEAAYEADSKLTGATLESPLWDAVWRTFDAYTAQLEHRLGDAHPSWLGWYQCDNDMGRRAMKAGYDDAVRPIRNIHDLAELLAEAKRR